MSNEKMVESLDTITAIQYLHHANEQADQALWHSTEAVADWIEENVPEDEVLPRGYRVVRVRSNVAAQTFLCNADGEYLNANGGYLHGDFNAPTPCPSIEACVRFADDVRDGLLVEIRAWLRTRLSNRQQQVASLEEQRD